tara:strand:- start:985 stop:2778 length:1794 start_codon:yes stop_codon:yes gene_type:complete
VGKVIVGLAGSHNAGITIYFEDEDRYVVIELERLIGQKNLSWATYNPQFDPFILTDRIKNYINKKYGVDKIDVMRSISSDYGGNQIPFLFNIDLLEHNQEKFNSDKTQLDQNIDTGLTSGDGWCAYHHKSHAAGTFYQSPFEDAVVFSFDGGGDDGWFMGYKMDRVSPKDKQMKTILYSFLDVGNPYMYLGYFIDDINYVTDYGQACLVYAGKLMGYAAYGNIREDWIEPLTDYYHKWNREGYNPVENDAPKFMEELGKRTGLDFIYNWDKGSEFYEHAEPTRRLEGQDAKDLIATSQHVFEEIVFKEIKPFIDEYKTNVCLTGGCAMNILFNTKVKEYVKEQYGKEVYVAPNSSDCGLSTGLVLDYVRPKSPPDLTYAGEDVVDKDSFFMYTDFRNNKFSNTEVDLEQVVHNLVDKQIYGVVQGKSEHGPRALGNRSIICIPKIGMKQLLNERVKHREYYRPFAPIVRLEDVSKYFNWEGECRHMNFACTVKENYTDDLASIIHEDSTARVQTITREQNTLLYDLLTEMEKQEIIPVLLNTSFNVNGRPILNSYKDAFYMLENSGLRHVIVKNEYTGENGQQFTIKPEYNKFLKTN